MNETCVACERRLDVERTRVRRADGTVRFEMCNSCFDHRFCAMCLTYCSSLKGRQEHRCRN